MAGDEYHKGNFKNDKQVEKALTQFRKTLRDNSANPIQMIKNTREMITGLEQKIEVLDEEAERQSKKPENFTANTEEYRVLLAKRDTLYATLKGVEEEKIEDYIDPNWLNNRVIRWASGSALAGLALGAGIAIGLYDMSRNPSSKYSEPSVVAAASNLSKEKEKSKDLELMLARNQKLYNPNVRYDVAYSLGKSPMDFVLKVKNQKTNSEVDLTNTENWDNMLSAGGYHNFMNASRISGLDKYFTKDAVKALEDYSGSVLIHSGTLRFFVDGKEVASSEVEPAVLKKTWELYVSRKNK